jgi:hypothetical protein
MGNARSGINGHIAHQPKCVPCSAMTTALSVSVHVLGAMKRGRTNAARAPPGSIRRESTAGACLTGYRYAGYNSTDSNIGTQQGGRLLWCPLMMTRARLTKGPVVIRRVRAESPRAPAANLRGRVVTQKAPEANRRIPVSLPGNPSASRSVYRAR